MLSLQQQLFCTTRIPLFVPPDLWDERHRRILRLASSNSRPPPYQPTSDTALLPKPRLGPYIGDKIDPQTGKSVYARNRAFWDFLAGTNHVNDVLDAGGRDAERLFFYWRYPDDAIERWLHLVVGTERLALQPDTLLCVRTAQHAIPVLAHLWANERIRERAELLQTTAGSRMRTTPYAPFHTADDTDPTPPPYGVAVLLALAQEQHCYFAQRANPPDSYRVRSDVELVMPETPRAPYSFGEQLSTLSTFTCISCLCAEC
jgi:hypothetical protein